MNINRDDIKLVLKAIEYAQDTLRFYIEEVLPGVDDMALERARAELAQMNELQKRLEA